METFRTVFYTPIYVSVAGGFLEQEGLDVTFSTSPSQFPHPLSALKHGAADIVQSGIMRCIIALDWGAETAPQHFAEINARDGFFVLSREPQPNFSWDRLRGASVIPVGFSPMPWASFQYAMRNNGVDPGGLNLLMGLSLDDAIAAFREGRADFIHLPQPAAEQLIADGTAHPAVALGPENGHMAYSSFAATREFLARRPDTVRRFVAGFAKALEWLNAAGPEEIARAISSFFPDVPLELLSRAVERLQTQGTWPSTPALEQPEFERLQDALMAAGLVREHQPYELVVTREFA
jgi:NitT/TauT family transport system substrate-binding protein